MRANKRDAIKHCAKHPTYAPKCCECWHAAYGGSSRHPIDDATDDNVRVFHPLIGEPIKMKRPTTRDVVESMTTLEKWDMAMLIVLALVVLVVLGLEAFVRSL